MQGGNSSRADRGVGGMRRLALLWAFVLALLGQSIVTQSHVHMGIADARATMSRGAAALSGKAPGHAPGECLLCWEKAQAGSYVVPVLAAILTGAPALFALRISCLAGLARRSHRHGWRSRAPPARRR
jgi:hypothetical protein